VKVANLSAAHQIVTDDGLPEADRRLLEGLGSRFSSPAARGGARVLAKLAQVTVSCRAIPRLRAGGKEGFSRLWDPHQTGR
jgi:hypothetical protein